jgi:hypothetical protein
MMTFDFSSLYRSTFGFDHLADMFDTGLGILAASI